MSKHEFVDAIRSASRQMVRELGFMQATLAATNYPASAVHAILEIGARGALTAVALGHVLGLEKSSISRMVRKLIEAGELRETTSERDARVKLLSLTAQGKRTLVSIHEFGRQQVTTALTHLSPDRQQAVGKGLSAYADALTAHRLGKTSTSDDSIAISTGYQPGAIGRVTEMHALFYARHADFGQFFESKVATGLAEFADRLTRTRNGMWLATQAGRIVGSVSIDGEDLGRNLAHLRWFIVDDALRGAGVGRGLLEQALDFCDRQGFDAVHLWTFKSLDAARRLYEAAGFELVEEQPGSQWGKEVMEQRFVR